MPNIDELKDAVASLATQTAAGFLETQTGLRRVNTRLDRVTYFAGRLGDAKIVLLKDNRQDDEADPVWNLLLDERRTGPLQQPSRQPAEVKSATSVSASPLESENPTPRRAHGQELR